MKKSEFTQLTQIIEALVAKEVRKQLPVIIAETFQNMMGNKAVVTEQRQPKPAPVSAAEEELDLKTSLREMFAGTPSTPPVEAKPAPQQPRHFTKDPVLNKILNETVPLRQHERNMGSMPAFLNQYQPAVASAMPSPVEMSAAMGADEPAFTRGMPSMPIGTPPVLREGQESNHAPMQTIPDGVSALDVARQVPLAAPVAQALTRNYSQMMKIIDKKKKGALA